MLNEEVGSVQLCHFCLSYQYLQLFLKDRGMINLTEVLFSYVRLSVVSTELNCAASPEFSVSLSSQVLVDWSCVPVCWRGGSLPV